MSTEKEPFTIVVPWHTEAVKAGFCEAWGITGDEPWLILQKDPGWKSCHKTKNAGLEVAHKMGAKLVIVLDDDIRPSDEAPDLHTLAAKYELALQPQPVARYRVITSPPSRGTPFLNRTMTMPVACVMSYWLRVADWDSPSQLVYGAEAKMDFYRGTVFGDPFSLSGMAVGFDIQKWYPWCLFQPYERYDDIVQGWLWQREAYRRGYCFNLNGPLVTHARQSDVFKNLRAEALFIERAETLWRDIFSADYETYEDLLAILPPATQK